MLLCEEIGRAGLAEPVVSTAAVAVPLLRRARLEGAGRALAEAPRRGRRDRGRGAPGERFRLRRPRRGPAAAGRRRCAARGGARGRGASKRSRRTIRRAASSAGRVHAVGRFARGRGRCGPARSSTPPSIAAPWPARPRLVGATDRLLDLSVAYVTERQQFGVPIGILPGRQAPAGQREGEARVRASAGLPRRALGGPNAVAQRAVHVSMAKVAAGVAEAAQLAAQDRACRCTARSATPGSRTSTSGCAAAWSLEQAWGLPRFHRQRLADFALAEGAPLGAGRTFL